MSVGDPRARLSERAAALKSDTAAVWLALRDERTPLSAKAAAAVTVAYALSPIDLIPDFIPVLGYLDDVVILPALIALTLRLVPAPVMADCRKRAQTLWENGRPKRCLFAIPVVLLWAAVVWLIVRVVR